MIHLQKIDAMKAFAEKLGCELSLDGTCGFGRPCVGITLNGLYPDYEFTDATGITKVWVPEGAYHKHPCVAVLGHGEASEAKLYEWLKWFEDNAYVVAEGVESWEAGGGKVTKPFLRMVPS